MKNSRSHRSSYISAPKMGILGMGGINGCLSGLGRRFSSHTIYRWPLKAASTTPTARAAGITDGYGKSPSHRKSEPEESSSTGLCCAPSLRMVIGLTDSAVLSAESPSRIRQMASPTAYRLNIGGEKSSMLGQNLTNSLRSDFKAISDSGLFEVTRNGNHRSYSIRAK